MTDCRVCSGYGTILLHDKESDEETERPCHACVGSGITFVAPNPFPAPHDLEKELDEFAKRIHDGFEKLKRDL